MWQQCVPQWSLLRTRNNATRLHALSVRIQFSGSTSVTFAVAFGQCILSNPWLRLYACIGAHTTHHRCLIGPVKLLGATYAHTTHRATNKKTGFQYPWTTWGEDTNYNKCTQWATVLLTSNMHDNITRQANMTAADMMDFAFVSRSQSLTLAWKILKLPMPDQRLEPDPLYKHILYCMASHLSCWSLFFISPSLLGIVVCATYADCIIYIYTCDRVYVCRSNSQHSMRCLHSVLCINDGRQFDVKGQMKYIQQKQRKKCFWIVGIFSFVHFLSSFAFSIFYRSFRGFFFSYIVAA